MNIKLLSTFTNFKTNNQANNLLQNNNKYSVPKMNILKADTISFSAKKSDMVDADTVVNNPQGIHLAPLTCIAKLANSYDGDIFITKGDDIYDAKDDAFANIGLISEKGTKLNVAVEGENAEEMLKNMVSLLSAESDEEMSKLTKKYTNK